MKIKTEKPTTNATPNAELKESGLSMPKKKDLIKSEPVCEQPALKPPVTTSADSKPNPLTTAEHTQMPTTKQITANSRRRKSTTSLANHCTPPKATMLSSRRDTIYQAEGIEMSSKIREYQTIEAPQQKPAMTIFNEVRLIPKEMPEIRKKITPNVPIYTSNPLHRTISSDGDAQIIEAIVPPNVETIKGTRNVMNAISQGAQLVKVIDSKIIKQPVTLSNMYVTKSGQSQPQPIKTTTMKQTFTPVKNLEFLTANDVAQFTKTGKAHKIQVITSDAPSMVNSVNVVQRASNYKNNIISIPTARNPNIVKTSDKTIMHVSLPQLPPFHQKTEPKKPIIARNRPKYQQPKHIVKFMLPQQQHRTVTIHPNTTISKGMEHFFIVASDHINRFNANEPFVLFPFHLVPTQVQTINESPQEYIYEEQVNNWQNYDPRIIDQNGYTKIVRNAANNGHDYRKHATNVISDNIIYDEEITEEYITSDEFPEIMADNVVEMQSDNVIIVSNNVGS